MNVTEQKWAELVNWIFWLQSDYNVACKTCYEAIELLRVYLVSIRTCDGFFNCEESDIFLIAGICIYVAADKLEQNVPTVQEVLSWAESKKDDFVFNTYEMEIRPMCQNLYNVHNCIADIQRDQITETGEFKDSKRSELFCFLCSCRLYSMYQTCKQHIEQLWETVRELDHCQFRPYALDTIVNINYVLGSSDIAVQHIHARLFIEPGSLQTEA